MFAQQRIFDNSHRSHTAITYPRNHAPPTVASLALVSFLVSFRSLPPKRRRTSLRVPLAAVADRSVAQLYPTQNTTSPGWHLSKCSVSYLGCLSCMTRKCKVWICTRREEGRNNANERQTETCPKNTTNKVAVGQRNEERGKERSNKRGRVSKGTQRTRRKLKEGREQCERRRNKPVP
jgi:hypothetical protein